MLMKVPKFGKERGRGKKRQGLGSSGAPPDPSLPASTARPPEKQWPRPPLAAGHGVLVTAAEGPAAHPCPQRVRDGLKAAGASTGGILHLLAPLQSGLPRQWLPTRRRTGLHGGRGLFSKPRPL